MNNESALTKETIFRDSKSWYSKSGDDPGIVSQRHIDFFKKHSGQRVLDLGCATGNYCLALKRSGYDCTGVDINPEYVKCAQAKGVDAQVCCGALPFGDKSFDTVIMSEVLEHLFEPQMLLQEAKRVSRKNVLITVPDCSGFFLLKEMHLTYEHMLELDHTWFYAKRSLENLLRAHFSQVKVSQESPVFAQGVFPWYVRKPLSFLISLRLVKPVIYSHLFAVCGANEH
jgi:ubiquinone/menaquinone biosynthesis C-methylase UbiE